MRKSLLGVLFLFLTPFMALAGMPEVAPIGVVAPAFGESTEIRFCTGAAGGAYHDAALSMLGGLQAKSGKPVSIVEGGGTVGCLRKMAAGQVEVAIVEGETLAWLDILDQPILNHLGYGSEVVTEDFVAVCSRKLDVDEFNDVAQSKGYTIALAGGVESGSLLTANVLAASDRDFNKPDWKPTGGWVEALDQVKAGVANCAFGVISLDAPIWQELNDRFGKDVRIVGFWDGNMRDLAYNGQQVYGWRAIPEDVDTLDRFLDWNGKGKVWSPETGTSNARVIYRSDMLPSGIDYIGDVSARAAKLKETNE